MIQSDKKIKEDKVVHFYNDAKPVKGCTKYYACFWFTDDSAMFYNYIYAKDRAGAFKKAIQYLAASKSLNFVANVSINEANW